MFNFHKADERGHRDTGAAMSTRIRSAIEENPDPVFCLGAEVSLKNEPISTTTRARPKEVQLLPYLHP
jgi:hypothetical protein